MRIFWIVLQANQGWYRLQGQLRFIGILCKENKVKIYSNMMKMMRGVVVVVVKKISVASQK